jgi:DNA-directed RNA polymerase subunit RPC12/RpoP
MAECGNCGAKMEPETGGLRGFLSSSSPDGYACTGCGATLCSECKRQKEINAMGGSDVKCGVCGGTLEQR